MFASKASETDVIFIYGSCATVHKEQHDAAIKNSQ